MNLSNRIDLLALLGKHLEKESEELQAVITKTFIHNGWFTVENIKESIRAISTQFLDKAKLEKWAAQYRIADIQQPKNVALVMAGNIPLVGFHDWLCVFLSGHKAIVKLSDKDKFLLPYIFDFLSDLEPSVENYVQTTGFLKDFDVVIATGSNNSARYFESYFGKYPHIIRKNRTSVAVLEGNETKEELLELGKDIFKYFGLGCRSVSKIYVPENYDFEFLMETLHEFKDIVLHHKYKNNFDYNFTLLILNKIKHYSCGCLLLREGESLHSRIAGMHYEVYHDVEDLKTHFKEKAEEIQCIVSKKTIGDLPITPLGKSQEPSLTDYADGVDTMAFLTNL